MNLQIRSLLLVLLLSLFFSRPAYAQSAPPAERETPIIAIELIGVGGASLLTSIITGALTLSKKSTADAGCSSATLTCTAEAHDAATSGRSLGTATTLLIAAGSALAAAGGIWIAVAKLGSDPIALRFSPRVDGVQIGGAW